MITRITLILVFLLMICLAGAGNPQSNPSAATSTPQDGKVQFPPAYVPPGRQMYREYCAACHGSDGKGRGPVATSLRKPPPNLTTLARAHGGNFPRKYVTNVLRFGPGYSAHGSFEMPVWGPIFQYLENYNEAAVRQRIKNLCDHLESIQGASGEASSSSIHFRSVMSRMSARMSAGNSLPSLRFPKSSRPALIGRMLG